MLIQVPVANCETFTVYLKNKNTNALIKVNKFTLTTHGPT